MALGLSAWRRMMKNLFRSFLYLYIIFIQSQAAANVVVTPINVTSDTSVYGNGCCGHTLDQLIDQSGLTNNYVSLLTDFDSFTLNTTAPYGAATPFPMGKDVVGMLSSPGSIFFDLGSSYNIDAIAFWNQSSGSAQTIEYALYLNDSYTVRGSGIKIGHFYPETDFDHFIGAVADIEKFAAVESQFFEIELIENLNCPTGCTGFNEILFASPIPVPAAAWLFGSAIFSLGLISEI